MNNNIEKIKITYHLWKKGISIEEIPKEVEVDRATIYRWIKRIKKVGIREYVREYRTSKKGRRKRNKTPEYVKKKIYEIRKEYRRCCGQKIQWILEKEYGIKISVSTIYIVLKEKYKLRSKWKKNQKRGYVIKGERPRHVIQIDTVDLGEIYAYTAIDTYTREAHVVIKDKLTSEKGKEALEELLKKFGKIERIQKDGGSEFKKEWEEYIRQIDIQVRVARPYKKNEQAYIERFNGILRKECVGHIKYRKKHLEAVQRYVDQFLDYYHNKRPHLSLNFLTPIQFLHSYSCRI